MANRRHNIGLLVATITDDFSYRIVLGAMEAAKQLDVNLIVFPGKYVGVQHINDQFGAKYEYQYNVLFDLAAQAQLDYLIVAVGTIAFIYDQQQQMQFLKQFEASPLLSVALVNETYPFLQFDDCSGIADAVDYLAAHGRKHIGMMVGELNNEGFVKRYHAYRERLEAHGLPFRESYIMPSNFAVRAYPEIEALLDNNPELDAIVCTTDIIAADVYHVLKQRGLRVGADVAVIGFDDLPVDEKLDPPLASVRADAVQLGQRAVEKAVHALQGLEDNECYLPTQFVPRTSCFRHVDDSALPERIFRGDFDTVVAHFRNYFETEEDGKQLEPALVERMMALLEHLRACYVAQVADEGTVEETLALFQQIAPLRERPGIEKLLDASCAWLVRNCHPSNISSIQILRQEFYRPQNMISSAEALRKYLDHVHVNNVFVRDALMFSGTQQDSYAKIMERLHDIGVESAFLYTFEQPIIHRCGDRFPSHPVWMFRAYSYETAFTPPRDAQRMTTPEVFNNPFFRQDKQHILVAATLFSAETQYGLALFEPQQKTFINDLELVSYQMSSAVRTLDMLRQQEALLQKQERLLQELHTTNLALEEKSKVDELTKVYNRKGFFPAADALIHAPQNQGKPVVICYADMDNLKMVNDTYGHAEGDFSIKLVAQCLAYVFGDGAVIGRMGGDEFAAIVPASPVGTLDALVERKEQFIRRFHESHEKPYPFDLSMGMLECVCNDSYDLKAALDQADDLLYTEKREKKRKR